jgi:hypothetical protein
VSPARHGEDHKVDLCPHRLAAVPASEQQGHPALLVDDELARAVRIESAAAVVLAACPVAS